MEMEREARELTPSRPGEGSLLTRAASHFSAREETLLGLIGLAGFLAVWQYLGDSGLIDPRMISTPSRVLAQGFGMIENGELWVHVSVSMTELFWGLALSIAIGIPLGFLIGWYRTADHLLNPYVSVLLVVPIVAFFPLLVTWVGLGIESKVAIVFLGAVVYVLVNTMTGTRTIDQSLLTAARSFGANDWQVFTTLALPHSAPFILSGIRLGVGVGMVGVVVGEFFASTSGLGYTIVRAGNAMNADLLFTSLAVIVIIGVFLTEILKKVEARVGSWRPERT